MPEITAPPNNVQEFNYKWRNWLNNVYERIRGPAWGSQATSIITGKQGATAPTLTAFGPSGTLQQFAFAVNDYMYISGIHVPMNIKPSSKAYLNIHWSTNGTDVNTVKWEVIYSYAQAEVNDTFPSDTTIYFEGAPTGTAWEHIVSEDSTLYLEGLIPETLILVRVKRITNGGTDNADTVFGLYVDLHYEIDRFGSPNRDYDFYRRGN